jgi:hypothetical protein
MDRINEALLDALKRALAEPGEQRLFRSGKLDGLFPGRGGVHADAAALALREGYLEVTRTETRGKTSIDWVRITPRGVNWLHDQESPLEVLRELRTAVQTTRDGVPLWLADIRLELQNLEKQLTATAQRYLHWLEALDQRIAEALRRAESAPPSLPETLTTLVPWGLDALTYLDRRQATGSSAPCSLPELFAAVREGHPELSLSEFHDGIRRLHERRAVRLQPPADPAKPMPEPEYALVDGDGMFYFVSR